MKTRTKTHRTHSVGNQHIELIEARTPTLHSWGVRVAVEGGTMTIRTPGRDSAENIYYSLVTNAEFMLIEPIDAE